jgi:hypothetical protein
VVLGASSGSDWLGRNRRSAELDLESELSSASAGPLVAGERIGQLLHDRISQVRLRGPMTIAPTSVSWTPDSLVLPVSDPDGAPLSFPPTDLLSGPVVLRGAMSGDVLAIEALEVPLGVGALAEHILDAESAARGIDTPTLLAISGSGCDVLATWVSAQPELAACDDACAHRACLQSLSAILATLTTALDAIDATGTSAAASGELVAHDADGDLVPELFDQRDPWSGEWSGLSPILVTMRASRSAM